MATKCRHCGSSSYGHGCVYGPGRLHRHGTGVLLAAMCCVAAVAAAASPQPEFAIELFIGRTGTVAVASRDLGAPSATHAAGRTRLEWKGHPRLGAGFTAVAEGVARDGATEWTFSCSGNASGLKIGRVAFPVVDVPCAEKGHLLYSPDRGGGTMGWKRLVDWKSLPCGSLVCSTLSPGFRFVAVLNGEDSDSFYLDVRDPAANAGRFEVRKGPGGTARLAWLHDVPLAPENATACRLPFAATVRSYRGDWFEAATFYREWARTTPRFAAARARDMSRLRDIGLWMWNRGLAATVIPPVERFQADTGLKVALDWYWWFKEMPGTFYPDYWPPREGAEKFKADVQRLRRMGVFTQAYLNGMTWDEDAPSWRDGGLDSVAMRRDGSYFSCAYNRFNPNHHLANLCGEAPKFQARIREQVAHLVDCGFDSVYLDMIGCNAYGPCFNPAHRHVPGGGTHMTDGFRAYLKGLKSAFPGLLLSTEDCGEAYVDIFDSNISTHSSYERHGWIGTAPSMEFVPVFQAVYHGCAAVFGNYAIVDNVPYWDPRWPMKPWWSGHEERLKRDFPDQFAVEFARGPAWGLQPSVHNFWMHHATNAAHAAEYRFIRDTAKFYHANREFLFDGEMRHPGKLACARRKVQFAKVSVFDERVSSHSSVLPTVFHNVWKSPDGKVAAILVNWTREPQDWTLATPEVSGGGKLPPRSWALVPAAAGAAGGEVWRLGEHDGTCKEFRRYHAWEYGSEPWVAKSGAMDPKTHCWTYKVPGPGRHARLPFPCEICTRYENISMPDGEVVTGLRLVWDEKAAVNRRLRVDCASFSNSHGKGDERVELLLDDGRKKVFLVPMGQAKGKDCFGFEAIVPARSGENAVTLRIAAMAKHCRLMFDSISLHETDAAAQFAPVLEAGTSAYSGIAHPGDAAMLRLRLFNATGGEAAFRVLDFASNVVHRGTVRIAGGAGEAALPTSRKGWFAVEAECQGARAVTSYAVVEPPEDEFVDDSRFGCHAILGDGYFLRDTSLLRERADMKMRRAWLGGAKWVRLHRLSWACREPERGRYVWDDLDRRVDLALRRKMRVLFNVGEVPEWNSPTNDARLTVCGDKRFKMHPPVDGSAWARFVSALVARYRGRVEDFEIGNEPGFTSAFWMSGSPEDFAEYLKTAYKAAHEANPKCRIYPGAPLDTAFHEAVLKANGGRPFYDVLSCHYLGNQGRFATQTAGWMALNAAFGLPRELVNTEDMGWASARRGGRGETVFAAQMAKLHVREAMRGVKRTFAFQVFDDLSGTYSFFDANDAPLVSFAVYRAMTHRLEHARYVGDLSTMECEAYVFDRRGTPVIACWNDLKMPYSMSLPLGTKTATLVDEMDNEKAIAAAGDGMFSLPVATLPRYVEGGDWTAIRKAIAARPKDLLLDGGSNPPGENVARSSFAKGRRFKGRHFATVADKVPVRYGETYVFAATIRGKGGLDGIYSLYDRAGNEVFPRRQGLNCFKNSKAEGEWRTVTDTVGVSQEDAAAMRLVLVPNFHNEGDGDIEVKDVTVARISETCSVSKALHRGVFGRRAFASPVEIPGAKAWVRIDEEALAVAFEVADDAYDPPTSMEKAYMKDCVQFAIDPADDGADRTEFTLGQLADGTAFLFKSANYSTPELPDNITRRGIVRSAKVNFSRTADGWRIEASIPLREVYPLKADASGIGFDFLVNDCDGGERSYREWTPGIGGVKSAADFGHLGAARD